MSKEQYQDVIIQLLDAQRRPLPTRKIAVRTEMAWITAKKHLKELESLGKITHFKKSNKIFWDLKPDTIVSYSMKKIK